MRRLLGVLLTFVAVFVLATSAAHAEPDPPPTATCTAGWIPDWMCQSLAPAVAPALETAGAAVPVLGAGPTVGAVVDFVQNPLGYLAAAVTGAAVWLMGQVMLFAAAATQPDLTASFWIDTYRTSFAIAVVVFVVVLMVEITQVARRRASADDLIETVTTWLPALFIGWLFGPPVAQFLLNGATYLADGIIHKATGFSGGDAIGAVADAAANAGLGGGLTGAAQAFMSLLIGLGVLFAAAAVFVSLCLQALMLYLLGALFPIGWVWITTRRNRATAWRIPRMFLVLAFSKALLFIVLGLCMGAVTAGAALLGDGPGRVLATAVIGTMGLLLAAFMPLILLNWAPVMPGTSVARQVGETGSALGRTGSGAARTARDGRELARAGSKLGALATRRSRSPASAVPKPDAGGQGRPIDSPISPSSPSSAAAASVRTIDPPVPQVGAASASAPTATRPGRPNPAGQQAGAAPAVAPTATAAAAATGGGQRAATPSPGWGTTAASPTPRRAGWQSQERTPTAGPAPAFGVPAADSRTTAGAGGGGDGGDGGGVPIDHRAAAAGMPPVFGELPPRPRRGGRQPRPRTPVPASPPEPSPDDMEQRA